VTYAIFGGLLVRSWIVMPFAPQLFQESRLAGQAIAATLRQEPGRLYVVGGDATNHNMLVYVKGPISAVSLDDLAALNTPAMAVLLPEHEQALSRMKPALQLIDKGDVVCGKVRYNIVEIIPPE
jgi:hypothetical protein